MEHTLLLNATFEPLKVISWKRAMSLWCDGRVEILDTHDRELRAVTFSFKVPSIVRLLRFVKVRNLHQVKFSRANIYTRDNYTLPYLPATVRTGGPDVRSRRARRAGRSPVMGEHRRLLRAVQSAEGQPDAGGGRHDVGAPATSTIGHGRVPCVDRRQADARVLERLSVLERRFRRRVTEHQPDVADVVIAPR